MDGLHVKLHSHDTERLSVLTSLLKENVPPNPDEIDRFIKSETTTEDGGAIIDANGNTPDGCLPVSLYLYDECSICKVLTNDRFRLYPSDNNLNRLSYNFGSDLVVNYALIYLNCHAKHPPKPHSHHHG